MVLFAFVVAHRLLAADPPLGNPTVIGAVLSAATAPTAGLIFLAKWATKTIDEMRKENNDNLKAMLPLVQQMTSLQRETIEALERIRRQ